MKNPLGNFGRYDIITGKKITGPKRQPVTRSQKNYLLDVQRNRCAFCKKQLKAASTHFDHIKEVSKSGKSTTKNLRALCANCHYERHNTDKARKADKKRKPTLSRRRDPFGLRFS